MSIISSHETQIQYNSNKVSTSYFNDINKLDSNIYMQGQTKTQNSHVTEAEEKIWRTNTIKFQYLV